MRSLLAEGCAAQTQAVPPGARRGSSRLCPAPGAREAVRTLMTGSRRSRASVMHQRGRGGACTFPEAPRGMGALGLTEW